jgi:hypothetical protein
VGTTRVREVNRCHIHTIVSVYQESGIWKASCLRQREYQFPDGEIPDRSRKALVSFHRVSGICETRTCDFRIRDLAKSDFPIWIREIIRSILWVLRTPDKGVEEHFSSSGLRKRRSCGSGRALGGAFASEWYQSTGKDSLLSVAEDRENSACLQGEEVDNHPIQRKKGNCPKKWNCPEKEVGQCRIQTWREMRNLHARMEDMETSQRRKDDIGDISESKDEGDVGHREEEIPEEDAASEHLLKVVARMSTKVRIDILVYEENLDAEELLDWIRDLDTYFDYEDIEEDKKVRHAITRLKGHVGLWWDELQDDRHCQGKQKIKSWDRMIENMNAKFIPKDYQISLFRRMKSLRQKMMTMKEYTEEFYRLNIKAGHHESNDEKVARYINGLRYEIQDEISMATIRMVEDAYQLALKDEEKLSRK